MQKRSEQFVPMIVIDGNNEECEFGSFEVLYQYRDAKNPDYFDVLVLEEGQFDGDFDESYVVEAITRAVAACEFTDCHESCSVRSATKISEVIWIVVIDIIEEAKWVEPTVDEEWDGVTTQWGGTLCGECGGAEVAPHIESINCEIHICECKNK